MNDSNRTLIDSLISEFQRGIDLIQELSDSVFVTGPDNTDSIGAHFRHNLDFAASFLNGIETGRIDYSNRGREKRIETDREYAISRLEAAITSMTDLRNNGHEKAVEVRSEVVDSLWLGSTIAREIESLHSHTVHHYALIAAKLKALDIELDEDFGVAPSTLKFWDAEKNKSVAA